MLVKLPVDDADAFSTHVGSHGIDFKAANLMDGQNTTSWQYDRNDTNGQQAYVCILLRQPSTVCEMSIRNGYWKISSGLDQYTRNSRVKEFALSFRLQGEKEFTHASTFRIQDEQREQTFSFEPVENVAEIRFDILSIYKGTKFPEDVAISEMAFMGLPGHTSAPTPQPTAQPTAKPQANAAAFWPGAEIPHDLQGYEYYETIELPYESGYRFENGVAWLQNGQGLWGAINTKGSVQIPFEWETRLDLGDGYSFVSRGNERLLINRSGKDPFEGKGPDIQAFGAPFADGYTWAVLANGRCAIVSKQGASTELSPDLTPFGSFSSERLLVKNRAGKFGYVDRLGRQVIDCSWPAAYPFSDERAMVQLQDGGWGFITLEGAYLFDGSWKEARPFCNGRAAVMNEEYEWGFINLKGKLVIPCRWMEAGDFYNDRAPVAKPDLDVDMAGFVDGDGALAVNCRWEAFGKFEQRVAPAYETEVGWYLINHYGTRIGKRAWEEMGNYSDGIALVYDGSRYGFMSNAEMITDCIWTAAMPFSEGLAWVESSSFCGFINKEGEQVLDCGSFRAAAAKATATPAPTQKPSAKKSNCSHLDDWGFPIYGEVLETWQEHRYEMSDTHYTTEFLRIICGNCGEEFVYPDSWYSDHVMDDEGYCTECLCNEQGQRRS